MGYPHKTATKKAKRRAINKLVGVATQHGMGIEDIASLMKVSPDTVQKWIDGVHLPHFSLDTMQAAIDLIREEEGIQNGREPVPVKNPANASDESSLIEALLEKVPTDRLLVEVASRIRN